MTIRIGKFRTPDMVCRRAVRFMFRDEWVQPNIVFEAECRGRACLSCLEKSFGLS